MFLAKFLDWAVAKSDRIWQSQGALLGFALLFAYLATVAAISAAYPLTNWDTVAYAASALDDGSRTVAELHRAAWDAVRERVSEGEFVVLTSDRPYRIRQYADADAFATMLGFYEVKLLYVELTALLSRWMQPVDALRLISTVSAIAFGAVLLGWAWSRKFLPYAPFVLALLVFTGFGTLARMATPDLFASVFLVLAAFLYLRKSDLACAAALLLAFLARPDHLAFIGVFAVVAAVARQGALTLIAALVIALAAYFPIVEAAHHPGWWIQMWFTHIEYEPTLAGFDPDFSILTYLDILLRVVIRSLVEETWLALFLLECIALGTLVIRRAPMQEREIVLLMAMLATMAAKFVVFPLHEARFHIAYLVVIGMALLGIWSRNARTADQSILQSDGLTQPSHLEQAGN